MKSIADVLADAREYIAEKGWCRGEIEDRKHRVCAYGGLLYGNGWLQEDLSRDEITVINQAQMSLIAEAHKVHPNSIGIESVPDWNDRLAVNQQEILDVFMAAEKQARSGNVED